VNLEPVPQVRADLAQRGFLRLGQDEIIPISADSIRCANSSSFERPMCGRLTT